MSKTKLLAGLFWIGYGAYVVVDGVDAAHRWTINSASPTGLFTDIAQAFVGQTGAVILEILAGLAFVAAGTQDIRRARRQLAPR